MQPRVQPLAALGSKGGPRLTTPAAVALAAAQSLLARTNHQPPDTRMFSRPPPQDKQYPRDWWLSRGRVRVQLFNEDGTPVNPEVPNREWR